MIVRRNNMLSMYNTIQCTCKQKTKNFDFKIDTYKIYTYLIFINPCNK